MSDAVSKTFNAGGDEYNLTTILGMDVSGVTEVAPGFQVFPKGVFRFKVKDEIAEDAFHVVATKNGEQLTLRIPLECIGVDAMAGEGNSEEWVGVTHNETLWFPNDPTDENANDKLLRVIGNFRYIAARCGVDNTGSTQDIINRLPGATFVGPMMNKKDKNDPDIVRANLNWDKCEPVSV